jgi:hypothetical protein
MQWQHSYRMMTQAFGQNWHPDASSDAIDIARSSTIGSSSNMSERTSVAPGIDHRNSVMTLAQR